MAAANTAWLLLLLSSTYQSFEHSAENVKIDLFEPRPLKSPHFPHPCCKPGLYEWYVEVRANSARSQISIYFDDLDLPPGSNLTIYSGKERDSKVVLWTAKLIEGTSTWSRPAFLTPGEHVPDSIRIEFIPAAHDETIRYVGFKMQLKALWHSPRGWGWNNRPISSYCPAIVDVRRSGVVPMSGADLSNIARIAFAGSPQIDCVWQLKPPSSVEANNMEVYVRVAEVPEEATFEIFDGISSEGATLYSKTKYYKEDLRSVYYSRAGLYVRLHSMPFDWQGDSLRFTYGLFKQVEDKSHCRPGFMCQTSQWCIPKEAVCNNVTNCPQEAHDERNCDLETSCAGDESPCDRGRTCYTEAEHCDGVLKCADAQDETGCHKQATDDLLQQLICEGEMCADSGEADGFFGLTLGAILGITLGCIVAVGILVVMAGYFLRKYYEKNDQQDHYDGILSGNTHGHEIDPLGATYPCERGGPGGVNMPMSGWIPTDR